MKKLFFSALVLLIAHPFAFSAEEKPSRVSLTGSTGLILNTTASALGRGEVSTAMFFGFTKYMTPSHDVFYAQPRSYDLTTSIGASFGIGYGMEAGLALPLSLYGGVEGKTGLGAPTLFFKYVPFRVDGKSYAFGFNLYARVPPGTKRTEFASGKANGGGELIFAFAPFEGRNLFFHGGIGAGYDDYYDEGFSPPDGLADEKMGMHAVMRLKGFIGIEYFFTPQLEIIGELTGWRVFQNADDNLELSLGMRYETRSGFMVALDFGGGVLGVYESNNDLFATASFGYSYRGRGARAVRPVVLGGKAEEEKEKAPRRRVPPEKKVQKPAPAPQRPPKFAVLNACVSGDATSEVAKKLILNGFEVTYVGESKRKFKYTVLLFNREHLTQAKKIAGILPGRQRLVVRKVPRKDGIFVIYAGCDQLPEAERKTVPVKETPPPAAPPPPPAPPKKPVSPTRITVKKLPKDEIAVRVLNACGTPGLASAVGKKLILSGFMNLVEVGNAPERGLPATRVYYKFPYRDEAEEILKTIGSTQGKVYEKQSLDVHIEIHIGCDASK